MIFNLLFEAVIYVISVFLMILTITVYRHTLKLHSIGKEKISLLEATFNKEKSKGHVINEHVSLANSLEQTLFYGFFNISKELIELQKSLLNSV